MDVVRESRAGDDFHLLWAARRALTLVDPRSELQLMRLEGLVPADAPEADDRFLGVDLSEYYAGEELRTARAVVVTQLKYSVRHPERRWTAARLTARTSRRGASVLRRLADIFAGLVDEMDGDVQTVVSKVRVRLVSNQAAAATLIEALSAAQSVLTKVPVGTPMARISRTLPAQHRPTITRLQKHSGLQSQLFAD